MPLFTSYVLNMFRTLIYPSSGACDCVVELPYRSSCSQFVVCWSFGCGWFWVVFVLPASACNTSTTENQPHQISNTQRTENKTTDVVIQQHSRKLLMMDILMSETCWAHKKWNKIASDIKLVFHSTITMMHGPINITLLSLSLTGARVCFCISKFQIHVFAVPNRIIKPFMQKYGAEPLWGELLRRIWTPGDNTGIEVSKNCWMNVDETGSGRQPIVVFDIDCAATLDLAGYKHSCTLLFCTMFLLYSYT